MPPRQPIMPKRTSYYASQIKKNVKYKKGHKSIPEASFGRSDKAKMLIRSFPDVLEKIFSFDKILITEGPRSRPTHQ